jgi:hypothetical protein
MYIKYVDEYLAENTNYKSVYNEWNRDNFSILVLDNAVWYVESRGVSDRTYKIIKREMKRLFPKLKWLGEV